MGKWNRAQMTDRARKLSTELNNLLAELQKPDARLPLEPGLGASRKNHPRFVTFVKYFNGTTPYRYVAVRPEGKKTWAVSGQRSMVHTSWDQLMKFVLENETDEARAAASVRQLMTPYNNEDTGLEYADDEATEEDLIVDAMNYQTHELGYAEAFKNTGGY